MASSALTTAKRKKASPETLAVLRRSLTDLKIAVDSLEPIEGDVVLLLASIRHRLEPELREAGLSFDWHVENAPPLPWLDAVGALHVLRLLQEAIGNILLHAGTAVIQVHCGPAQRKGREGVEIIIADQGCGFDLGAPHPGKGLANMAYRAEALRAEFRCESAIGQGTKLTLWLPPHR
jgi:signal transduction histidine kinase